MVGQEHVTCLKLLSDFAQQFASLSAADEQSAEIGTKKNDLSEYVASFETYDDIRAGPFRYVTASGKQGQRKDHLLVDRDFTSLLVNNKRGCSPSYLSLNRRRILQISRAIVPC